MDVSAMLLHWITFCGITIDGAIMSREEWRDCPDGGRCWHRCAPENCMRVRFAGPLSGVFPNDEWPDDLSFDFDIHSQYEVMRKLES